MPKFPRQKARSGAIPGTDRSGEVLARSSCANGKQQLQVLLGTPSSEGLASFKGKLPAAEVCQGSIL